VRVIIRPTAEAACVTAARIIAKQVLQKPASVLGLATGGTPLGCYRELIRLHRERGLDFSSVTTFNLDEYLGLPPEHPQSYRTFMFEHLFHHINVDRSRIHLPDGMAKDTQAACEAYERAISEAGGIDLQLLGIGTDGHIAFNEPGSSLASRTRIKTLLEQTVRDNARFFDRPEEVPRLAVTMGVGTILDSRQCLLLGTGENKAAAIRSAIEGPVTSQNTASALQLHRDTVAVLDEAAASWLTRRSHYQHAESHMPDPDKVFH
jgi:glucosamine-6-phosphate deaminase